MSPVVENNQYQSLYQSYLVTHKKVYDLNQKLPGSNINQDLKSERERDRDLERESHLE